ncbi:MAG: DUF2971 domain-containing protein [Kiritimatiellales bacterium]|nr:DUF2971 domain-containing protein [Kiritimatiellales bacterium]
MKTFYFYTDLESEFNCRRVLAMLDGKLPLANPSHFNDPFDSRLRCNPDFTDADARKYLDWDPKRARIFPEQDPIFVALEVKRKEILSRWTAFSVSEVEDSLLMWAHYGAQHKGLCLELEYDETKRPESALFSKIRYTTHYPQDIRISLDQGLDSSAKETLLLTKSIDWHYEREWRLAVQDASPEVDYNGPDKFDGVIDSPFKVTGVCYGFRCEDGDHSNFSEQPDENMWKYTKIAVITKIDARTDISVCQSSLSATEFSLKAISYEE